MTIWLKFFFFIYVFPFRILPAVLAKIKVAHCIGFSFNYTAVHCGLLIWSYILFLLCENFWKLVNLISVFLHPFFRSVMDHVILTVSFFWALTFVQLTYDFVLVIFYFLREGSTFFQLSLETLMCSKFPL